MQMTKSVATFLMFTGRCEEAITFYTSLISNSKIESVTRWAPVDRPRRAA
jgi:predicted 3-demethylubiquinone-9 3-methyltransferase (glyoxalase superfamily)